MTEEDIARALQAAADSGELASAKGYGQALKEDEGWDATPEALRMPFKILKNAGFTPPEVELFHERARLREAAELATDENESQRLRQRLAELEQALALRLESLRRHASL